MNKFNEKVISKKYLKQTLKTEVESSDTLLNSIYQAILNWLIDYQQGQIGKRYKTKDKRLSNFINNEQLLNDCCVAILHSTLTMKSDRFQELISLVSAQIRVCEDEWNNIRTTAEMLAGINNVVYELVRPRIGSHDYYIVKPLVTISDELAERLSLGIFLPPATSKLDDWTNKYNGGYELSKSSAILGDHYNLHDGDINLKVLNILQNIGYELTEITDTPEVPSDDLNEDALKQFYLREPLVKDIYTEYKNKPFYFVWQYDKRGRIYDKGYDIHIQGNEYHKASLRFSKKEKLTNRGIYWLKVDLANTYGLDKLPLDKRVNFIDKNIDDMLANKEQWISKADEPLLFELTLNSYVKGVINKEPIGHITRLDATCSGPQIMSVIMIDIKAMKTFNILGEQRNDFYTLIAKKVKDKCPDSDIFSSDMKEVRKAIKKPLMTFFYNSKSKPKELLGGDNSKEYNAFIEALQEEASGALELMEDINECFDENAYYHAWRLPDGHNAYCPVTKVVDKRIELHEIGNNLKIQYRYKSNEPNKDEWRSLTPNIIHSIDGWIVRQVTMALHAKGIELSPIHDSFGVHPNYCDELRKAYRGCISRLYRENIIDSILSDVVEEEIVVIRPNYNPSVDKEILNNINGCYIC